MLARRTLLTCLALAFVPVAGCTTQQSQQLQDLQLRFARESGVDDVYLTARLESLLIPVWEGTATLSSGLPPNRRTQLIRTFFQYAAEAGLKAEELARMGFYSDLGTGATFDRWPTDTEIEQTVAAQQGRPQADLRLDSDGRLILTELVELDFRDLVAEVRRRLPRLPKTITEASFSATGTPSEPQGYSLVAFQQLPVLPGQLASMALIGEWIRAQEQSSDLIFDFRLRYGVERSSVEVRSNTEQREKVRELAGRLKGSDPHVTVRAYLFNQMTWPYMEA